MSRSSTRFRTLIPLISAAMLVCFDLFAAGPVIAQGGSLVLSRDIRAEGAGRALSVLEKGSMSAWGNVGGLAFSKGFGISAAIGNPGLYYGGPHQGWISASIGCNIGSRRAAIGTNYMAFNLDNGADDIDAEHATGWAGALELFSGLGIGVGLKSYHIRYIQCYRCGSPPDDEVQQTIAPVVDVGVLGVRRIRRTPDTKASVGISFNNLGRAIQLGESRQIPLPRTLKASAGLEIRSRPARDFGLWAPSARAPLISVSPAVGIEKRYSRPLALRDTTFTPYWFHQRLLVYGGAELKAVDLIALRTGYLHNDADFVDGATWGAGISLLGHAGVDYANVPSSFVHGDRVQRWGAWFQVGSF